MTKKQKLALTIIISLSVVLFIFIWILNIFAKNIPEEVEYPAGNLSDSIFESQNTFYTPSQNYDLTHKFSLIPYSIDTVDAECAKIDTGAVYISGSAYFFYSEIEKGENVDDCIKKQFSQVLEYGVEPDVCNVETFLTETGFINGFTAEYQVLHLSVPSEVAENGVKDAYMVVYRLEIDDNDEYPDNYDVVMGVGTQALSTETLAMCKALLDEDVLTIQYDSNLAKQLIESMNASGETEDIEVTEATEEELQEEETEERSETSNDNDAGELVNEEVNERNYKTMGILLKQNYKDLTIVVDWTNLEQTPTLVFCDVREESVYNPETTMDGRVVFHVGEIEGGVYMVKILGWENAGTFTSTLIENGQEEITNAE